jgi:hypothetical protein
MAAIQFDFDELTLSVPGGKTWVCFSGTAFANRRGRITGIRFDGSNQISLVEDLKHPILAWLPPALAEQYEGLIRELLEDEYDSREATYADAQNDLRW